jgi:hypothetical protein
MISPSGDEFFKSVNRMHCIVSIRKKKLNTKKKIKEKFPSFL